mmetsp:Transcript_74114/g.214349  ORF Transcript_74114/g.214349 Transcript_74114/m.214349 type:complete len:491 (-) Transcript_74114:426-1898(-)
MEGAEHLLVMLLRLSRHLELHVRDLLDDLAHGVVDGVPADLVLAGEFGHGLLRRLMEADDHLHHADGLREGAHEIVVSETVLLQEVLADDLGDLEGALLVFGQRVLADELHDLLQVILLLQDLLHLLLQHAVFRVVLLEVRLQGPDVLRERDVPVDRREVLPLRELLVQPPEYLDDRQGRRGHRICEVTAGRGHGADNGDGAFAGGIADALHAAAALVEGGQPRAQVGRIASVRRHLSQSSGDLTQGLGPSGGAVCHHGDVVAHVTEVLRRRDTGVNRGLPGGHGHVRGVRHKRGPLHDGFLLSIDKRGELGEVRQHLGHLVPALAAADIHDHIGVRVLRQRLRDHRLATTERARDCGSAALSDREERVDHPFARQQRGAALQLFDHRARLAHRPPLEHLDARDLTGLLDFNDIGLDCVIARRQDLRDAAGDVGVNHDVVALEQTVLANDAHDVAARNQVANLDVLRGEVPRLLPVQVRHIHTARHEHAL